MYVAAPVSCMNKSPLKNVPGGFLTSNFSCILSYAFDGTIHFQKALSTPLLDMFLVSSNHVVFAQESNNTLSVCNIYTGEEILHVAPLVFDFPIVNVFCNLDKKFTININVFKWYDVVLCVLLASMDLHVFHVRRSTPNEYDNDNVGLKLKDKKCDKIKFIKAFEVPGGGLGTIDSLLFFR